MWRLVDVGQEGRARIATPDPLWYTDESKTHDRSTCVEVRHT